jgi:oligopeptide/dipeptide ABC transporter ATP-binding protein
VNTSSKEALLSVRGLTVTYPGSPSGYRPLTAVRGVDLDIPKAGILALVGESGSGKTSLAHAVLQLVPADSGRVVFRGQELGQMDKKGIREARRRIQAVFQDPLAALSPRRSIRQALLEPLNHFRIGTEQERGEKIDTALESVGLEPGLQDRFPHELSGGQRQRVALARALVTDPDLVVADEPVSSLDVSMQARIVELILELRERLGVAFLFVSHDLSVVRRLADSVAVMYAGRLVETGPAGELFRAPAHPYTRALLAASPVADPKAEAPAVLQGEPPSPLTPPTGCVFHKRCDKALPECAGNEPEPCVIIDERSPGEHRVRCHLWKQ